MVQESRGGITVRHWGREPCQGRPWIALGSVRIQTSICLTPVMAGVRRRWSVRQIIYRLRASIAERYSNARWSKNLEAAVDVRIVAISQ